MILTLRILDRPGPALQEVLCGLVRLINDDIAHLPEDTPVRIHDIRVSTKKIHSLLRLADDIIPAVDMTRLVEGLRQIKNSFSGSRDEDVMRQELYCIFPEKEAARICEELGLAVREDIPETQAAIAAVSELDAHIGGLDFSALTPGMLVNNATASYRRARKLMRRCKKSPKDRAMHKWRKRVKDACYHAMALSLLPRMEHRSKSLDDLADALGAYHDLAVLGARIADCKSIGKSITSRVAREKRKTGRKCFHAAKKIFRRKPKKFRRKLAKSLDRMYSVAA